MYDVKFYFVFTGSMLNPIREFISYLIILHTSVLALVCLLVYGFNNVTMRRAFRLTFPFLFKEKVILQFKSFSTFDVYNKNFVQAKYVMKRKADGTTTIRVLMDNNAIKNSVLHRAIIETGRV